VRYEYDIVLSFAGEDRRWAEQLRAMLIRKGAKVFYDRAAVDELWGKDLYQHLQHVYRDKGRYCVIFASKNYKQKRWTKHELRQAQARAFRAKTEYILPLRLDDTEIPGLNETTGYIDLRTVKLNSVATLLARKLRLKKPRQRRASVPRSVAIKRYYESVFVNVPFDLSGKPTLDCIVFTVIACGFRPRCVLEVEASSQSRLEKISDLIKACRYGIHDLSRVDLDRGLPRLNMPLELGMFVSAQKFGDRIQNAKVALVLDREPYRFHRFISDISGMDVRAHQQNAPRTIGIIREWLAGHSSNSLPRARSIQKDYGMFTQRLPKLCKLIQLKPNEVTFNDFTNIAAEWLSVPTNPPRG